jgi:hypothetical protein
MLKAELEKNELPALTKMYEVENAKLHEGLLDGMQWAELTEQRKLVIAIAVVIDAKTAKAQNLL